MSSYKPLARAGTNVFGRTSSKRQGLSYERVALMMLRALEYSVDLPDPATQKAIDEIAAPFRDRSGLFDWLQREVENSAGSDTFGVGGMLVGDWIYVPDRHVKRATGKTREQWLSLLGD